MKTDVQQLVRALTKESEDGKLFPDVVRSLTGAGVERYHADLVQGTKTYYMPDGSFEIVRCSKTDATAEEFRVAEIRAAISQSQKQEITYLQFCDAISTAGCVGYFVSIIGQRAVYYGRRGDLHVEKFPGSI